MVVGFKLQVISVGAVHLRVTALANSLAGITVRVKLVEPPAATVALAGDFSCTCTSAVWFTPSAEAGDGRAQTKGEHRSISQVSDTERATWCYTLSIMPQFVIEREIPGAGKMSESEIRQVSLRSMQVLKEMGPQIQWLHSYVTEDKIYCVYLAPDEDSIREHARRAGIPADRVAAVRRLIDPANLK
jgi:Nickel responsive protein SCO4226-like